MWIEPAYISTKYKRRRRLEVKLSILLNVFFQANLEIVKPKHKITDQIF